MVIGNRSHLSYVFALTGNICHLQLFILRLQEIYKLLGLKILIPKSMKFILHHLKRAGLMINLGFKWLELFNRHIRVKARNGRDWRVL